MIYEKGLRIPVGAMVDNRYSKNAQIFQIHIVEESDLK